ncbi:MAG: hypothetical protein NWQ43_03230 [Dolichospermum sp.]|nr:hypothetical protein [Dolichospermum sp.]
MKAFTTVLPARLLKKNKGVRSQESEGRRKKEEGKLHIVNCQLPITDYQLPQLIYPIVSTILHLLVTQINSKNITTYYDDSIAKI